MAGTGGSHPGNVGGERGSSQASANAGKSRERDKAKKKETLASSLPSPSTLNTIQKAFTDPSRLLDTPANARIAAKTMAKNKGVTAQTPGSLPNFPLADPLYGPAQFMGTMPPGPTSVLTGISAGLGTGLGDILGLSPGPQMGWTKGPQREETQGNGGTVAEERKKKKKTAAPTLLQTATNPLGLDSTGNAIQPI